MARLEKEVKDGGSFMHSKFRVILILVLMLGLGCPGNAGAEKAKYKFKLASLAPKNVGWARHIREIIHPALKEATHGDVRLKWYWGGVMGNDRDYIQKMKIGQLHGAAFTGQGVVLICPEMAVLELPFMFNNYDEVDYVRKKMTPTFDKFTEKRGYKLIAWADQDFDQIYSVKWRMDKLEDFGNARFLTWYGPMEQKVLYKLGARLAPVNVTELSPSIRQGVGDTLIAPAIWIVGSQLYTVIKYVNPVRIRYSPTAVFVTLKAFNSLPPEHREGILTLRGDIAEEFRLRTREDSEKSYKAMVKYGIQPSDTSPEVLKEMSTMCRSLWYEMAGTDFPRELLDELLGHLEEYRAREKN